MTPADMALEDFAGALASGRDLDFDAALGMARTAASDPLAVSKRTGVRLPDSASAEDFLVGEFLDRRAEVETDFAVRAGQADRDEADRETNDAAFAYAGMTAADIRKMQADTALGDPSAAVRVAQKFYFG